MAKDILNQTFEEIFAESPLSKEFFDMQEIGSPELSQTPVEFFEKIDESVLEDQGLDVPFLKETFAEYVKSINEMAADSTTVDSITIIGGQNKFGEAENVELEIKKGDVVCIVGPTGSGKSRLLADIEWMADGDTPSGRKLLVNGKTPDRSLRYAGDKKLVAQLSQNMNFVMDMSAEEFITLHAESRFVENPQEKVKMIIEEANKLAGEEFSPNTPLTSLSGGQSRALMIADTAFLSSSPVVLIDEIENAGIDRKLALKLLVDNDRIVLMATHDPVLALYGDRRVVIEKGGIKKVIETGEVERKNLPALENMDRFMLELRNRIRTGDSLEELNISENFYIKN